MRAIVQRVNSASVSVDKKKVGKINKGYFVLLGVKNGDTTKQAEFLAKKISNLRIMSDKNNKMNLNLSDSDGECLVVSQFTLYANTNDGNRPSFANAAESKTAEKLYNIFIEKLKNNKFNVQTGKFGAFMNINLELDGPATIIYDTNE